MTLPGGNYFPPQPPPPRQNNTLRTVLIIVGVVCVLCCGGAIIGGIALFRNVSAATGPVKDKAEEFVNDLEGQNFAAAYGLLCTETRAHFTEQQFSSGVPKIASHSIDGINVTSMNGRTTATATVSLKSDTGFADQHVIPMVKEDGDWKICGSPY